MADRRFVTVDDGYLFPTPLEARLGAKIDTAKTDAITESAADASAKVAGVVATSNAAIATANDASADADNAVDRVTALESAAGFGPSTPTDGTMADYIANPASLTAGALSAAIGDFAFQAEDLFTRLDLRDPAELVVAGAGDSTTDSAGEYLETGLKELMASRYPERPAGVRRYNKGAESLGAFSQWQDGETPGSNQIGVLLGSDTFTRTAPDLIGTMPDTGSDSAWEGNAAAFEVTGSRVNYVYASTGIPHAFFKIKTRTGLKIAASATLRFAFNLGSSTQNRFIVSRAGNTTSDRLEINVAGTATPTCVFRQNIGGVETVLGTFPAGTIPSSSAAADYAFSITVDSAGQATATLNGNTLNATLSGAAITALTGDTWVGFGSNNAEFEADAITVSGDIVTPPVPSTLAPLTVYNGGYAGGRASHQIDRFAAMYPVRPDLFLICHGHNYATVDSTPGTFIAAIEALVTRLHSTYPGVPVGFVSQNPETTAGGNRTAQQVEEHRARQAAMRGHCKRRGWVYIPAMESFAKLTDGGASKVQADGVHIDQATTDTANKTGGRMMADALKEWAEQQGLRPSVT